LSTKNFLRIREQLKHNLPSYSKELLQKIPDVHSSKDTISSKTALDRMLTFRSKKEEIKVEP